MLKTLSAVLALIGAPVLADIPVIKNINATQTNGLWDFDVTLQHTDIGWDDYADAWRILGPNGEELGLRKLSHPHVEEQPLTRSLSGIRIPNGMTEIDFQVHDTVNGWSPETKRVSLK
jgi:hypothetical protein